MKKDVWQIVPLCDRQKRDINKTDILYNGLARKCNVYKGGGGYDKFPFIYEKRFGTKVNPVQFVVQLYGCPLNCDYCYVTKEGIWGPIKYITTTELLNMYKETKLQVFHLMGGAPALYLDQWKEICYEVEIFHSDFLLMEKRYYPEWIENLPGLYAVSIKNFKVNEELMFFNLDMLIEMKVNFYLTFTGIPIYKNSIIKRYGKKILEDAFNIEINKNYKALK